MPPSEDELDHSAPHEEEDALLSLGARTEAEEEPASSPRHASKIKGKLSRLHRRSSPQEDEGGDATPQVFFAPPATSERVTTVEQRPAHASFRRAATPEDDFIVTTHPFVPTQDRSLHGLAPFDSSIPWKTPERVVGLERLVERHRVAFFDIETSGLRNTDSIICAALGFWLDHHPASMFHVKHYFIFHPRAEANMLRAMLSDLCAFDVLCTYNGKSFDVPRIKSRCNHLDIDAVGITRQRHADLVHTARRLLPKRNHKLNLAMMEQTLLEFSRSHDLPGSEVPRRWHQFTASQDLSLLDEIRDHNLLDVVSLAALLEIFAQGGPGKRTGQQKLLSPEDQARGQQALPLAAAPAPPKKRGEVAARERIVQPPSHAQAMSPLQRKLARSYQLKSKSSDSTTTHAPSVQTSPQARATQDDAPPRQETPTRQEEAILLAREEVVAHPVDQRVGGDGGEEHARRPAPSQQVGPRVAQLRALIAAKIKEDDAALSQECLPLVMELVALDPHHTQGLRWMIACYEQLGATALARTIRARYDAQDPYS